MISGLIDGYDSEYFDTKLTVIATPVGVLSSTFASPRSMAKWFFRRISATAGGGFGYVRFENRVVPPPTATGEDHHVALSSPNDSARYATPSTSTRASADPSPRTSTPFAECPSALDPAATAICMVA